MKKYVQLGGWLKSTVALLLLAGVAACKATDVGGGRTDPDIARAARLARVSFERGSLSQAERLYERALQLARAQDDVRECGTLAYHLALCRLEQGRLEEASKLLVQARADYERLGRVADEIALLEAEIARRQQQYATALALVDSLQNRKGKKKEPIFEHQVLAWMLRARVAADQGELAKAKEYMNRAKHLMKKRSVSAELQAQLARGEAQTAQLEEKWVECAAAYDRETEVWRGARQYRRMAMALARAADAYARGGANHPALQRFYLAARCLAAQGDDPGALKLIELALPLAEQAPDGEESQLLVMLFEEIKARAAKP